MTLKQFILIKLKANQDDVYINEIIELIVKDVNFPETEDIKQMARYLYKNLDQNHTLAFQKLLMFWRYTKKNNQQPDDMSLLNEINYIIKLQTNDVNYKYADEIPAHINNRK